MTGEELRQAFEREIAKLSSEDQVTWLRFSQGIKLMECIGESSDNECLVDWWFTVYRQLALRIEAFPNRSTFRVWCGQDEYRMARVNPPLRRSAGSLAVLTKAVIDYCQKHLIANAA